MVGYRPALWFNDSLEYVHLALRPGPYVIRPSGYSLFLLVLRPLHSFVLVVVLQHLIGLAVGVAVYALSRRLSIPGWAAAAAAAPQLLDGYQIALEHMVLSETLFTGLLTGAATALSWRVVLRPRAAAVAGVCLAGAAVTRSIGLPLAVAAAVWLLLRRPGWRTVAVFSAALLCPLTGYCTWHLAEHGTFGTSGSTGIFLYARTATFADCAKMNPRSELLVLCPDGPVAARRPSSDYIWHQDTPLYRLPGGTFDRDKERLARDFAVHAILAQPVDYLRTVGRDFRRTFESRLEDYPNHGVAERYLFGGATFPLVGRPGFAADLRAYERGPFATTAHEPAASWAVWYQRHVRMPAPTLGVLLLAGVLGLVGTLFPTRAGVPRAPLGLFVVFGLLSLLLPPMVAGFDYRYIPPSFPFLGGAAALAVPSVAGVRVDLARRRPVNTDRVRPGGARRDGQRRKRRDRPRLRPGRRPSRR
ncbi:hypothetical protein [Parafrankia discariae]|uniref:hypothetical protein n=1 Tax=Parafrankia discariae TaxID=365528 RepID=UPI00039ED7E2|nr:hypothetical protein [Parafrankia discariae]